jgi:two-component system, sensor histidine kinase YesM
MRPIAWFFSLLFIVILLSPKAIAQDTIRAKKAVPSKKMTKSIRKLEEALNQNDEVKIAKNYENLAQEFIDKGNNSKAEEYLKKALKSYENAGSDADKLRVTRSLARIQESQMKYKEAIKNYDKASEIADDKVDEKVNSNDARRLRKAASPAKQAVLAKENAEILENELAKSLPKSKVNFEKNIEERKEAVSKAYEQTAKANLKQSNAEEAVKSYEKAIVYADAKSKDVVKLKTEISKVYAADNKLEEALAINLKLLNEAETKNDYDTQITQLQSLANVYFKKNESNNAVNSLKRAYALATKNGKTEEVKKSLLALLTYYKSNNKTNESIALYDDFLNNFEQLIKIDTTLIDAKVFQVSENKIKQLEKEKLLKDALISKKNTFNYFLIGSMVVLLLFFGMIAKALFSIKRKNKEIALQSLRREMNPHFIFNSLNSVNQFISQSKEREANKYLTSYSTLMRNTMENSNKDFVTLSNEIDQLKKYLDLEHLRFQDQFTFKISVDEKLDSETTFVPNMIIQPHLENAIWHGLRYKDGMGFLQLSFGLHQGKVQVLIDDDGIGLTQSSKLKTKNQKVYESRGLTNTRERIHLLNELYKKEISFQITEKQLPETGTVVQIDFPLIHAI